MSNEAVGDSLDPTAPGPEMPQEPEAPAPRGSRRRERMVYAEADLDLGAFTPAGVTTGQYGEQTIPVEKGIPGERVHVAITTLKGRKGWTRATVTEVIEASSHRIAPPCPYFRDHDCGGCEWQHMADTYQRETKLRIVGALLAEAGIDHPPETIHAQGEPWGYRHSAAIALGKGAGFRKRRRQSVIPISNCPISHPAISGLLATLNDWYTESLYPDLRGKAWIEVKVVGTTDAPRLQLVIGGIGGMDLPNRPVLHPLAEKLAALPAVISVAYKHPSGETRPWHGPVTSIVAVGGAPFVLPAGSFFQTNLALLPRLIARIESLTALGPDDTAADIYCGAGLFTMFLARRAGRVIAIEVDPAAIAAARETARRWGLTNIEFFAKPAEKAMDLLPDLALALVDPPRSGLDPRVTDAIIAKRPRQFVYVSCNPVTLARDLQSFVGGGYTLQTLELFDFFPQTAHVESLAYLTAGDGV
ncbi:MAG: methyltransferase domain-containing protein [Chloroflexota bacterium]|nr:methyltransferase domain-containing protein [Chloroflexota bacterium]